VGQRLVVVIHVLKQFTRFYS